ncbi:MAG TPA: hypothetical protein VMU41_09195 [Candidatus Binataceae bacterium]|nr:hypothetical protein [Candidatus Binataceae bacterium]
MSNKQSKMMSDVANFFEAALIELPTAAARRLLSEEKDDQALYAAGWKAYDAFVRIANESANELYANPAFGQIAAQTLEIGLQARRASDAMASGIFRDLLPVVGLPAAKDVERLNRTVEGLREEVRALRAAQESFDPIDDVYAAARAAEAQNASAQIIWNGMKPSDAPRQQRQEKKSVAL